MEMKTQPSSPLAILLFGQESHQLCLKFALLFQVRELQTRLQSVQATGPSSPGRLTPANRPVNPSTGELSTSSSSNDIPIAKVSSRGGREPCSFIWNPHQPLPRMAAVKACGELTRARGASLESLTGLLCCSRREREPTGSFVYLGCDRYANSH